MFNKYSIDYFESFIIRTPSSPYDNDFLSLEKLMLSNPELLISRTKNKKKQEKTKLTNLKYLIRNNYRPTPFGLFAGVGIGKIGSSTKIILDSNIVSRKTELDYSYLMGLVSFLNKQEYIIPYVKYHINKSLFISKDTIRYLEFDSESVDETLRLSRVYLDKFIERLLSKSVKGITLYECRDILGDLFTTEEKDSFFLDLTTNKILISNLNPSIVGDSPLQQIISELKNINLNSTIEHKEKINTVLKLLISVQDYLNKVDQKIDDSNLSFYYEITKLVEKIGAPKAKKSLFKVDLFREYQYSVINREIPNSIVKCIKALTRFIHITDNSTLEHFKSKFKERWGNQEIPLCLALDSEIGIGYPVSTLDKDNFLSQKSIFKKIDKVKFSLNSDFHQFWLGKITEALQFGANQINFNDHEISIFPENLNLFPETFSAMLSIIDSDENFIRLKGVGGHSGLNSFGRFCYNDEIYKFSKEVVNAEEEHNRNKILAEINFVPENKIGNIAQRPKLREFEITCFTKSNLEAYNQINLNDLNVSIKNNKIILKSISKNCEVIPRNSNAHNYNLSSFPFYRFLCDVQTEGKSKTFNLDFSYFERYFNFIPRIVYNNTIVIEPAKWRINLLDLLEVINDKEVEKARLKWFQKKKELHLPSYFVVLEGDRELVIDSDNFVTVQLFLNELKKKKTILIHEFLFNPKTAPVKDIENKIYTNEIILVLRRVDLSIGEIKNLKSEYSDSSKTERQFPPGSEWLSLKIYTGHHSLEEILLELHEIKNKFHFIKKWFFVRYRDENFHLRIRFEIRTGCFAEFLDAINKVLKRYLENKIVWKVEIDTYERELERYGHNFICKAEKIFSADSELHLHLIKEGKERNWIEIMLIIDAYLTFFGCVDKEKELFVSEQCKSKEDLTVNRKRVDELYRANYQTFESHFDKGLDLALSSSLSKYISILKSEIKTIKSEKRAKEWMVSYIHMSINRYFKTLTFENEFLVYYFLSKFYYQKKNKNFKTNK